MEGWLAVAQEEEDVGALLRHIWQAAIGKESDEAAKNYTDFLALGAIPEGDPAGLLAGHNQWEEVLEEVMQAWELCEVHPQQEWHIRPLCQDTTTWGTGWRLYEVPEILPSWCPLPPSRRSVLPLWILCPLP